MNDIDEAGIEELVGRVAEMESIIAELRGKVGVIEGIAKQSAQGPISPIQGLGATKIDMRLWGGRGKDADKSNRWTPLELLPGGYLPVLAGIDGGTLSILQQISNTLQAQTEGDINVLEFTADATLEVGQSGSYCTNNGAAGTVILTLPAAQKGLHYYGSVQAAQILRFTAVGGSGGDVIRYGESESAVGGTIEASVIGDTIHLMCLKDDQWVVMGTPVGEWTVT